MYFVFWSVSVFLAGTLSILAAELPDVKTAKTFVHGGGEIILNESFDAPPGSRLPKQYSIAPGEGVNGTSALKHERTDSSMRPSFSLPLAGLNPAKVYNVRISIRSQNLKQDAGSKQKLVACAVEYYNKNGDLTDIDYTAYTPDSKYTEVKFSFKPRPGRDARFVCYLWHGWTGTTWFDDLRISSAGPDVSVLLTWPTHLTFRTNDSRFTLHADPKSPQPPGALVTFAQAGKTREMVLQSDRNSDFQGDLGKLTEGPARMTVRLLDLKRKQYLYEGIFNVNVIPPQSPPSNAATLDRHGRLIVDGKPFMPLGVFGLSDEVSLKRIADAGFNCLQLYSSFSLCGPEKTGDPVADLRAGMDRIQRHNLRLIFSLAAQMNDHPHGTKQWAGEAGGFNVARKAVECFKNHPALLAWYVSDETAQSGIPELVRLREMVNRIDPWHPAWTLTYRVQDMPYYGVSGDVFGVDPYPVKATAKEQKLDEIIDYMEGAQTTGLPIWAVPQIFNWAIIGARDAKALEGTRGPNAEEMRAMPLLCAIMGAKGFIFYGFTTLFHWLPKIQPEAPEKLWPPVVAMVQVMKSLEPFIVSITPAPEVNVESKPVGRVRARAFQTADGQVRVLIVALGPMPVTAEIKVPGYNQLKSRFGLTENSGAGIYHFKAGAIDSDILEN
ncbi:MAG: hypothetical protein BWY31_00300 [Lentisphaerae bacterium ADurb.Bin242]|nr:MAG: hypothetical protein BWY31_00300 [Lentisphaerae bacterium ADurb.Bin242]